MANQNLTSRFNVGFSTNYAYSTQSRVRSSATALTSAATANVLATPLTLNPGTYDLYGTIGFLPAATTTSTTFDGAIATTSATLPGTDTLGVQDAAGQIRSKVSQASAAIVTDLVVLTVNSRVTITSTTTFYLVAQATFAVSTLSTYGALSARQVA